MFRQKKRSANVPIQSRMKNQINISTEYETEGKN